MGLASAILYYNLMINIDYVIYEGHRRRDAMPNKPLIHKHFLRF